MSHEEALSIGKKDLEEAWRRALPETLHTTDSAEIKADAANPRALRIHIRTAGHTGYSFDFKCDYLDEHEVRVELVDVEQDGVHIDERQEKVQQLIEDYVRHIHECAQLLQKETTHA